MGLLMSMWSRRWTITPRNADRSPVRPISSTSSAPARPSPGHAFHLAEKLLTQPLQIILGGGKAGRLRVVQQGPIREKEHPRRAGATHYDLYDKLDCVDQAVAKLKAFYGENL
jgi:hypothetical protein